MRDASSEACVGDIFKIHDFNYILKVIQQSRKLNGSKNKVIVPFDGADTVQSEKTWDASLIAAGAVLEACDAVMDENENYRNAFCATRPPGHHAGIFGRTFHDDDP